MEQNNVIDGLFIDVIHFSGYMGVVFDSELFEVQSCVTLAIKQGDLNSSGSVC
jgi:hypothetical protein